MNNNNNMSNFGIINTNGVFLLQGGIEEDLIYDASEFILARCIAPRKTIDRLLLVINSPGGDTALAKQLIDIMRFSSIPVHTTVLGEASSAGSLISITGQKGHRYCTSNSLFMTHEYHWGVEGGHHELMAATDCMKLTHEFMIKHYVKYTNLDRKGVEKYLLCPGDNYIDAKTAKKYGMVDTILNKYK